MGFRTSLNALLYSINLPPPSPDPADSSGPRKHPEPSSPGQHAYRHFVNLESRTETASQPPRSEQNSGERGQRTTVAAEEDLGHVLAERGRLVTFDDGLLNPSEIENRRSARQRRERSNRNESRSTSGRRQAASEPREGIDSAPTHRSGVRRQRAAIENESPPETASGQETPVRSTRVRIAPSAEERRPHRQRTRAGEARLRQRPAAARQGQRVRQRTGAGPSQPTQATLPAADAAQAESARRQRARRTTTQPETPASTEGGEDTRPRRRERPRSIRARRDDETGPRRNRERERAGRRNRRNIQVINPALPPPINIQEASGIRIRRPIPQPEPEVVTEPAEENPLLDDAEAEFEEFHEAEDNLPPFELQERSPPTTPALEDDEAPEYDSDDCEIPSYRASLHKYLDLMSFDPRFGPCLRINKALVKDQGKLKESIVEFNRFNKLPNSVDLWKINHVDDAHYDDILPELIPDPLRPRRRHRVRYQDEFPQDIRSGRSQGIHPRELQAINDYDFALFLEQQERVMAQTYVRA